MQSFILYRLVGTQPIECGTCSRKSEHVYDGAWMCLNPECSSFWMSGSAYHRSEQLLYCKKFLEAPCNNSKTPSIPITPCLPPLRPIENSTSSERFWQGWWCRTCGKLTCRYIKRGSFTASINKCTNRIYWNQWSCSNDSCSVCIHFLLYRDWLIYASRLA